jgi:hypothetical protein
LVSTKKYINDQFLLTLDDDLNHFLAKSTTICKKEFTKIGVDNSVESPTPTKFFIILNFLNEHSSSMVPLLNHSTAHPPTTPLHWPLAVPNAYMA